MPGTDWFDRHGPVGRPGRRLRLGGKRGGLGKWGCWKSDQCLALIGLIGTDRLAGPAVACGSAVNEVDWASGVVGGAISAWH